VTRSLPRNWISLLRCPEAQIAIFSFLLNYPWEMLQAPLFKGMGEGAHWEQVKVCTLAALADALISLLSFWMAAAVAKGRLWLLKPKPTPWFAYMGSGLGITIIGERLAIGPLERWQYSASMPIVPGLEVGISPLLQWLILPPLVLWFARNQLLGLASRP
jgi:hypothetical protein